MLDRESTFAQPSIVKLLQSQLIPVAIDQAYQRRQKDTEGEFYRKIASQSIRKDFNNTTQGFYVADAKGRLFSYNNNRDPEKLLRLLQKSLDDFQAAPPEDAKTIVAQTADPRWNVTAPEGGLVLRVRAKVLGGYEPTSDRWKQIFQSALSRDNLWITKQEHKQLCDGEVPRSLQRRIARFHLVDNTRGEPPMWKESEIRELEMHVADSGQIQGHAVLKTASEDRSYESQLRGEIETRNGRVTKLNLISLGDFRGEGRFTRNAPKGEFPLAISFTLADGSDIADKIPPQGSRGWIDGYLK